MAEWIPTPCGVLVQVYMDEGDRDGLLKACQEYGDIHTGEGGGGGRCGKSGGCRMYYIPWAQATAMMGAPENMTTPTPGPAQCLGVVGMPPLLSQCSA